MSDTLRTQLTDELQSLVSEHFASLSRYVSFAQPQVETLDCLVVALESLAATRYDASEKVDPARYREVRQQLGNVEQFLQQINRASDAAVMQTQVGEILAQARQWCVVAREQFRISADDVWDLLDPVRPDHLDSLGDDVYEARWWKPFPVMDVELLRYTEGVVIQGQPYEPESLPGGIAVRFLVEIPPQ
jgi:hypothetical protein